MSNLCAVVRCPQCGSIIKKSMCIDSEMEAINYPSKWPRICSDCSTKYKFIKGYYKIEIQSGKNFASMIKEMDNEMACMDKKIYDEKLESIDKWAGKLKPGIPSEYKNIDVTKVSKDTDKLEQYLKRVLEVETYILCLENMYAENMLRKEKYSKKNKLEEKKAVEEIQEKYSKLENAVSKYESKVKDLEVKYAHISQELFSVTEKDYISVGLHEPQEPISPNYIMIEKLPPMPIEPEYEPLPRLFNRRKVEESNNALKREYEEKLSIYQKKAAEAERAREINVEREKKYNEQVEVWKEQKKHYYEKKEEINRELKKQFICKVEQNKESQMHIINEAKEKLNSSIEKLSLFDLETKLKNAPLTTSSIKVIKFIDDAIDDNKDKLREAVAVRNTLYSVNVIHPKYRGLYPIAAFYEYISTKRCFQLEGPDGAYNLYEAESRSDKMLMQLASINNKMDMMLIKLDEIKANQGILYKEIKQAHKTLGEISGLLDGVIDKIETSKKEIVYTISKESMKRNNLLSETNKKLDTISKNTGSISKTAESIARNTAVTAYNTALTAYYAKKNAEMTNALGWLIALK